MIGSFKDKERKRTDNIFRIRMELLSPNSTAIYSDSTDLLKWKRYFRHKAQIR